MNIKVRNIYSYRGNPIANQFIIKTNKGTYFQSYDSIIVFIPNKGKIQLDKNYWDYSATTGKYRNIFLGENKKDAEAKIKNKEYLLKNLN